QCTTCLAPTHFSSSFCRVFFSCYAPHRDLHSFPTRRSSDLSLVTRMTNDVTQVQNFMNGLMRFFVKAPLLCIGGLIMAVRLNHKDRKSTRLNSSHVKISYAVFCLKKKKEKLRKQVKKDNIVT